MRSRFPHKIGSVRGIVRVHKCAISTSLRVCARSQLSKSVAGSETCANPVLIAATAFAYLALAGCATTRVVTIPPPPLADRIPQQLLTCRPRPPAGALDRQSDVARWVVDADAAGEDCRNKLSAVNEIVREDGGPKP